MRHIRIHTKEKPFVCYLCKRRFALKNALNSHIKTHDNNSKKKYSCSACQKNFKDIVSLEIHAEEHVESNLYIFECVLCKSQFKVGSELKVHVQQEHGTRKRENGSTTNRQNNLFDDIKVKFLDPLLITENGCVPAMNTKNNVPYGPTEDRPHVCKICELSFRKISHLKQHELSHTNQRPHKCKYCEKSFKSANTLTLHIRAHLGQKPWQCPYCETSYISKTILNRHLLSHMNERKYLCPYCQKTFKSAVCCRRHIKIHKTDVVSQLKDVNFVQPALQQSNIILEETEFFLLPPNMADIENSDQINVMILDATPSGDLAEGTYLVLNENFATAEVQLTKDNKISAIESESALETIENINAIAETDTINQSTESAIIKPHKCVHCPRSFSKPIDFRRHLLTHTGQRPFQCTSCQKSFALRSTLRTHEKTHLDVKAYFSCHVCSNQFSSKSALKIHMRIHTGDKPFVCVYCNARFRTTGHKNAHERVHIKNALSKGVDPKGINFILRNSFTNISLFFYYFFSDVVTKKSKLNFLDYITEI